MTKFPNFIRDTNPWNLAGPPDYFLRQLWNYDQSLVLVPSRQGFFYRLCQRRPLKLPENVTHDVLKEQADTRMLASYGLVPFTTIIATVRWDNPVIFEELTRRAPWRMGGAKGYEQLILDQERQEALSKKISMNEHLERVAKDAWLHYNKQIGLRSHSFELKTSKAPSGSNSPALVLPNSMREYKPVVQSGWGDVLRKNA